jgi:hypothetical protein
MEFLHCRSGHKNCTFSSVDKDPKRKVHLEEVDYDYGRHQYLFRVFLELQYKVSGVSTGVRTNQDHLIL